MMRVSLSLGFVLALPQASGARVRAGGKDGLAVGLQQHQQQQQQQHLQEHSWTGVRTQDSLVGDAGSWLLPLAHATFLTTAVQQTPSEVAGSCPIRARNDAFNQRLKEIQCNHFCQEMCEPTKNEIAALEAMTTCEGGDESNRLQGLRELKDMYRMCQGSGGPGECRVGHSKMAFGEKLSKACPNAQPCAAGCPAIKTTIDELTAMLPSCDKNDAVDASRGISELGMLYKQLCQGGGDGGGSSPSKCRVSESKMEFGQELSLACPGAEPGVLCAAGCPATKAEIEELKGMIPFCGSSDAAHASRGISELSKLYEQYCAVSCDVKGLSKRLDDADAMCEVLPTLSREATEMSQACSGYQKVKLHALKLKMSALSMTC